MKEFRWEDVEEYMTLMEEFARIICARGNFHEVNKARRFLGLKLYTKRQWGGFYRHGQEGEE